MITKFNDISSKGYGKKWSKKILVINSVLKINHCTYKTKDLNGEKTIGSSYERELMLSYFPEPDSHIRDKAKDMSNYATKND